MYYNWLKFSKNVSRASSDYINQFTGGTYDGYSIYNILISRLTLSTDESPSTQVLKKVSRCVIAF